MQPEQATCCTCGAPASWSFRRDGERTWYCTTHLERPEEWRQKKTLQRLLEDEWAAQNENRVQHGSADAVGYVVTAG